MRLRNIPGSRDVIQTNHWCVQAPEQQKGFWKDIFHNQNPIHIEIGMGKGQFLFSLAQQNPNINYIGIEKYSSVLLRALQKMEETPYNNLKFVRMDATTITDVFNHDEIDRIYLNFSDPWPKDRHAKRRLTSKEFFRRYHNILDTNGRVEFKTDNQDLFDFSLNEVTLAGWDIIEVTRNLHNDPSLFNGNVLTEYEERFSSLGNPIFKLTASRNQPVTH
jgi:tRNA (guanine-N7-)-methyltransferase